MSAKTSIEWCDRVWNPVRCTRVSEGCRMAHRLAGRYGYPAAPNQFQVTLHENKLDDPKRWKKPLKIFVNSMSDLFHDDVPTEFILRVMSIIWECQTHTFIVLTKRPQRAYDLLLDIAIRSSGLPPNLWMGVSCENQETWDERVEFLTQIPAAVRFVSLEPLLGPVDCGSNFNGLDWIIVGGESGPGARPMHPDWVRSIRWECMAAKVPFFFKQWGEWIPSDQNAAAPIMPFGGPVQIWRDANNDQDNEDPGLFSFRCGKTVAGRELYGREWNEFPEKKNGH